MSAFTDHTAIEPYRLPTGRWEWEVALPLPWEIGKEGSGFVEMVPAGFVTDLASIPWWGRWLFNPDDPATAKPAIVHDWLLKQGWEQRAAAGEFYAAMLANGVPIWKRKIYYFAVVSAIDSW